MYLGMVMMAKCDLTGRTRCGNILWQLVHRARLYDVLKKTALSLGAVLNTISNVLSVDPETATVRLGDGRRTKVDLVVGADGIYVSGLLDILVAL